jgi:hypothetical protein
LVLERTGTTTAVDLSGSANWEWISVNYQVNGTKITNTIYKSPSGGPSQNGVLTKVSNTKVAVALSADVAFTLTVKFNGRSNGTIYTVPAA